MIDFGDGREERLDAYEFGERIKQRQRQKEKNLKIDLFKKYLTGTVGTNEPKISDPTFLKDFFNHYIKGEAYTMLPMVRLDNLQFLMDQILANNIPGDFIEAGVWRGGACMLMQFILKEWKETKRKVWVADSFKGLPEPTVGYDKELKSYNSAMMQDKDGFNLFSVSKDVVMDNFREFGLLDVNVHFLEGWFSETLPNARIRTLALMRLDGDYYESTMTSLQYLYPKLSKGGYVIVDDYGETKWTACKEAVDQYRKEKKISAPIIQVDSKCIFWRNI